MEKLVNAFVDRRRATILFLFIVMLLGYLAYTQIPKESNPDVKIPMIYVLMQYAGISPEDGQRLLLQPMENALRSVVGITKMTSYAQEGSATIILEFNAGFDSDKALRDVRDKVSNTTYKLPKDADTPTAHEINLSLEPVLNVIVTGDVDERSLVTLARDLKDKIEGVEGVLEVNIGGEKKDAIEVIIEPATLERYGIAIDLIAQIIASNNALVPVGTLKTEGGEYAIKIPSLVKDINEFLSFPIKASKSGVLRLGDIATVKKTFKDAQTIARVNGKSAVVLEISKRSGANIINTVAAVKEMIKENSKFLPASIEIMYSQDQSDQINEMIADLENSIILAGILVIIVIVLSVGVRSALLIALSLPASFLVGILLLSYMGLTLNIVVLFSLILTVGMIVDDAIVVSEYADRKMVDGYEPQIAFLEAATRMFWPIVTSTLVKIVVFMPLLFWPGVIGQFMKFMPITVIAILSNSLIFALCFQPALGPILGHAKTEDEEAVKAMRAAEEGDLADLRGLSAKYVKLLTIVLQRPKLFISSICGFLVSVYIFFFIAGTGVEFFPQVEPSSATISIGSPGNLSLSQKDQLLQDVEAKILDLKKDIKVFYAKSGQVDDKGMFPEDTIAIVQLELEDWQTRRKAVEIFADITERLKHIKGISFQILEERKGPPSQKPIEIHFSSYNYDLLPPFVERFRNAMTEMGGFKDVEDSRPIPAIEWGLKFDRELAAKYRVDVGMVGNMVKLITSGLKLSTYRADDSNDEVDILLRYPATKRLISELDNLIIVTTDGKKVPISQFVKRVAEPQVNKIKRLNQDITITVKSDVKPGVLADTKVKEIKKWLEQNLDEGINVTYGGDDKDQQETGSFLVKVFFLALVIMFMIMLIQFNSFYHTAIVMSAVFLSTVGVLIGLILSWQPFGIVMCGIGIIALAGVVLNNNILFVDTYQHLRASGISVEEAVIRTGAQRMRPILLTALTAILGLIPMVIGLTINFFEREITYDAPSSQWWHQLAASIAGGLSFATVLTLFFTPCLLVLGQKFEKERK